MSYIFLILICGLPFGNFLFTKVDIWHGHGMFFQLGILVLLCYSFIEKPKFVQITNKSLAIFTLWAGIITAYYWYLIVGIQRHYPIKIFFPFFNFLCFLLFYKFSIEYLNENNMEKILKWLSYSVLIVMFYCVLQKFNLDQFFMAMGGKKNDELVGTIGNSSHLAGYLALCSPLFFKKNLFNILSLILLWLIILATGSASGIIVGMGILLFWIYNKKAYRIAIGLFLLNLIGGVFLLTKYPLFFTSNHRVEFWQILYQNFKLKSITGAGMGIMNTWQLKPETSVWRHAHCEPYQLAVELGIIGLILALWCIWDYFVLFRAFKTNLTIKLASIFFGFCLLSLFTFPAHLWLLASMGMMGYSFLYSLKNEVNLENQT